MEAQAANSSLKVYFIHFVAPSHMVSLFEIARLFASRGLHVTWITTPSTAQFLHKSLLKAQSTNSPIHIHNLHFPAHEAGLPEGLENLMDVNNFDTSRKVYQGMCLLRPQMEHFMQQNPPDCIIADIFHPWTSEFATRLGIPRIFFDASGLFQACMLESIWAPNSPHLYISSKTDPFVLPGLPHKITMTFTQLPDYIQTHSKLTDMIESFRDSGMKCHGRIINGYVELEEDYVQYFKKVTGKTVWHVGPTFLHCTFEEKYEKCLEANVSHDEIVSWLDSKEPKSVLYICFGSAGYMSDAQLLELGHALESSGHDFIWVVHRKDGTEHETEEGRKTWMPREFELRMRREGRGLVIRGWAPQTMILNHVAVGGFMTHCGWNSVMEGIVSVVPMVTWPLHSEQFFNEKLITQVHGIGVEVGADNCMIIMEFEKKELVKRQRIESAIRRLMDGGDEVEEMRRRIGELSEKSKAAIAEGGSSHRNLTALIEEIRRLKSERTKAIIS